MSTYTSTQYRLRAGTPMAVAGGFVLHTFMAETYTDTIYTCTNSLPSSSNFKGQGGDLYSANFSHIAIKGGGVFTGKETTGPFYVEEG